jgi:hypothetical protein
VTEHGKRWIRLAGVVVGLALVAGAIVVLWQRREQVTHAMDALASPSPWLLALLLLSIVGNLALTSIMFHQLASRYGKVGAVEMQALIAASALANYLPLRPGLFGRMAYHATVNRIAARHSVLTIMQAVGLTACGAALLLLMLLLAQQLGGPSLWWMLPLPAVVLGALALMGDVRRVRPWCVAGLARYLDLLLWAARYAIAFALIGVPIELSGAVAFACVGTLATMVPLSASGLGLREWAVGLLAAQLAAAPLEMGITAELVNRAAEIVVVTIAGLAGATWLARRSSN